jgi:hypothetical protein
MWVPAVPILFTIAFDVSCVSSATHHHDLGLISYLACGLAILALWAQSMRTILRSGCDIRRFWPAMFLMGAIAFAIWVFLVFVNPIVMKTVFDVGPC